MISVLSRYLARMLLARVLIVAFGLAALMLILEFLAEGDQVIAVSDSVWLPLLRYTLLRLPEILAELIPISAMLACLLTFAELARHAELTAMYAAGVSKARLAVAVLPVALLVAVVQFLIEDQAVPVAVGELRAWGIGDYDSSDDQGTVAWLRHGDDIVRFRRFDAAAGRLDGVTIFQRDAEGDLIVEIEAATATHDHGGWTLQDVTRSWVGSGTVEHQDRLGWPGELDPALLVSAVSHPRYTPLTQLIRILHAPGLGTQPAYRYQLWLQERLAAPATTVALILIMVALARPLRGRATQGLLIATGVAVGFLCWTFDGLVLTFGDLGLIPPALAAWTPLLVFFAMAWSIMLHDDRRRQHRRIGRVTVEQPEPSG